MKIFLSSTFQDLQEHRKRVIEAIERLQHNNADVQWRGMEAFGARDDLPSDACVKFVDECELYIGFFGVRYGSLDPKSKLSMTEVEYRRAVEQKKSRLLFLVSDEASVKPKDFEQSPDGQAKLKALKEDLKKDRVVDFFTSPEDLASKVITALAQKIPNVAPQSLIPHPPLPYFVHPYPLQANFTGRKPERALLSDWLTRGERQTAPVFVVEALGGMGKSALAWYWLHNDMLPHSTDHWSLAGLFWWSFYDERDFGTFLRRALEYASGGATDAQANLSDRERLDALVAILRQKRLLFILDGFERVLRAYARMDAAYRGDEFDADAHDDYRACADPNIGVFLKAVACGGCLGKLLITSRLYPRELDELEGAARLPLTGMDAADAVAFFHAQNIHGTHTETETVCADYGFHPLSLRLLAGALVKDPRYHADIRNAPRVNPLAQDKERKILDLAYDSLPPREQKLLGQLSAFRSPLKWDALAAIFANVIASPEGAKQSPSDSEIASSQKPLLAMTGEAYTEDELARALTDLQERGLYMRDSASDTFDLHPVIRRYCYDRLSDRPATHARFIVYFAKIETPKKIQSLADLQATIELYHHTVRAGQYDEARDLFSDRLATPLYFQLGAYQLRIELLHALFPDGEDKPPRLKSESDQAWTLNTLANSYALAGQPRRAVPLYERVNDICENVWKEKGQLAIGLGAVASVALLPLGELNAAEQNQRRSIEICREIKDETNKARGHSELGCVLAYREQFAEAERELNAALEVFGKQSDVQAQSVVSAYRALRALLMGDASAALAAARKAREFAEEYAQTSYPVERDFIRAEWLIGAALVAGMTTPIPSPSPVRKTAEQGKGARASSPPAKRGELEGGAERHLAEALARDRKIGMVDHEAAILLEFAKLRKAVASQQSSVDSKKQEQLMQESLDFAHEALAIAERCEYRLQLAEIHNFLAEWWLEKAESSRQKAVSREQSAITEALAKAHEHAERAKERAWCDGPLYHYKVAYERAERLLKEIQEKSS